MHAAEITETKLTIILIYSDIEAWADTDGTFSEFFKECVKSPELCPLAQHSDSAAALEETIYNKLEELKFRPIPAGGAVIDSTLLQSVIRPSLYRPGRWTLLGGALHSLLSGDYMDFYSYAAAILADGGEAHNGGVATDAPFGIHCSDKNFRRDNLDDFLPELHKQWDQSKVLGDFTTFLASSCAQWDIEPKERYEGGFCGIKTRKPLLVVGNTFDPATSIKSAFNISAGFEDSVVLTQDGYGVSPCSFLFRTVFFFLSFFFSFDFQVNQDSRNSIAAQHSPPSALPWPSRNTSRTERYRNPEQCVT